jgi:CRISPR/Cas system-associated endoribonuclease Cas2
LRFLVAYDIADPRRLRRVARYMERRAVRSQKSVFLFHGDEAAVGVLLNGVMPLLEERLDVVQAWKLSPDQPRNGQRRGTAATVYPASVVLHRGLARFVESPGDTRPGHNGGTGGTGRHSRAPRGHDQHRAGEQLP